MKPGVTKTRDWYSTRLQMASPTPFGHSPAAVSYTHLAAAPETRAHLERGRSLFDHGRWTDARYELLKAREGADRDDRLTVSYTHLFVNINFIPPKKSHKCVKCTLIHVRIAFMVVIS